MWLVRPTKCFISDTIMFVTSAPIVFNICIQSTHSIEFVSCCWQKWAGISVTRLGNLLDFGQLFKALGNN